MSGETAQDGTVSALRRAVGTEALAVIEGLLAVDVQWYGNGPGGGCRSREEVLAVLAEQVAQGVWPHLRAVRRTGDRVLLEIGLSANDHDGPALWMALTLDGAGRIAELQGYSGEAAADHDLRLRAGGAAGGQPPPASAVSGLVPFVHVTDMHRSLAFYETLGFTVGDRFALGGETVWAALQSAGAALMLSLHDEAVDPHAQGVLFYLYARDLTALRDHLVFHGLTPGEIVDGSPGPKQEMRVTDPDGYTLMVAQIDAVTVVGE